MPQSVIEASMTAFTIGIGSAWTESPKTKVMTDVQPSGAYEIMRGMHDLASPVGAFVRNCCEINASKFTGTGAPWDLPGLSAIETPLAL